MSTQHEHTLTCNLISQLECTACYTNQECTQQHNLLPTRPLLPFSLTSYQPQPALSVYIYIYILFIFIYTARGELCTGTPELGAVTLGGSDADVCSSKRPRLSPAPPAASQGTFLGPQPFSRVVSTLDDPEFGLGPESD